MSRARKHAQRDMLRRLRAEELRGVSDHADKWRSHKRTMIALLRQAMIEPSGELTDYGRDVAGRYEEGGVS